MCFAGQQCQRGLDDLLPVGNRNTSHIGLAVKSSGILVRIERLFSFFHFGCSLLNRQIFVFFLLVLLQRDQGILAPTQSSRASVESMSILDIMGPRATVGLEVAIAIGRCLRRSASRIGTYVGKSDRPSAYVGSNHGAAPLLLVSPRLSGSETCHNIVTQSLDHASRLISKPNIQLALVFVLCLPLEALSVTLFVRQYPIMAPIYLFLYPLLTRPAPITVPTALHVAFMDFGA